MILCRRCTFTVIWSSRTSFSIVIMGATINDIAAEILDEVFYRCTRTERDEGTFVIPSPKDAPLSLTLVCKGWRDLVLTSPRMWSSISWNVRGPQSASALGIWLGRSGACPLSIRVITNPSREVYLWLPEFTALLQVHCPRISDLEIMVSRYSAAKVSKLLSFDVQILHSLIVHETRPVATVVGFAQYMVDYDLKQGSALDLGLVPNLRHLALASFVPHIRGHDPFLLPRLSPTTTALLTTLSLFSTSSYELALLVQQCPLLEELRASLCCQMQNGLPAATKPILPCLRYIELACAKDAALALVDVLDVLHAPALQSLFLHGNHKFARLVLGQYERWPHLHNFLVHSGATLKKLRFRDFSLGVEDLSMCLMALPLLVSLNAGTDMLDSRALQALAWTSCAGSSTTTAIGASGNICPSLQSLTVVGPPGDLERLRAEQLISAIVRLREQAGIEIQGLYRAEEL